MERRKTIVVEDLDPVLLNTKITVKVKKDSRNNIPVPTPPTMKLTKEWASNFYANYNKICKLATCPYEKISQKRCYELFPGRPHTILCGLF